MTADVCDGCEVVAAVTGGSVADDKGGSDWSLICNTTGSGLAEWNCLTADVFDGCEVVAVLTGGSVADGKGGND